MRKFILDTMIKVLEDTGLFKKVYANTAPVFTQIKSFPALAVAYDGDMVDRHNISTTRMRVDSIISIYLYVKQEYANDFEDITSEYIDIIESTINNSEELKTNTIDCIVTSIKQDQGRLHPYAMAQLNVSLSYLKLL